MAIADALAKADDAGLDLVEISPNAKPPVVKVLDYKKFIYEQKKKKKEMQSKATKVVVKEIRFGPNTDEHDFNFKLNHARKFLEEGAKLKSFVFFKGRRIVFKERGIHYEYFWTFFMETFYHAQMDGKTYDYVFSSKEEKIIPYILFNQ